MSGTLVNDGVIVIDPSTLTVADLTGTGQVTIDAGSTLEVQGTIAGGETIVFDGNGAFLRLDSGGTVTATASGDGVAISVLCFRAGTLILTPSGEHLIQELVVGDLVRTRRVAARRGRSPGSAPARSTARATPTRARCARCASAPMLSPTACRAATSMCRRTTRCCSTAS